MKRIRCLTALAVMSMLFGSKQGPAQSGDRELQRFREIYKELVETNTTLSAGDCTLAAKRMSARLKTAGYPDADLRVFVPDGHPKEGGLLAVLHGSDSKAKAILLLGHLDVVEAKREDWTRDPFTMIEENGYFYGRGTFDDKAQVAVWVDNLVRYREEGFKPKRSLKLALTCGEETSSALNGAGWLATHERDAIDAEFAINEGSWGDLDAQGHRISLGVLAAEKTSQNFVLEATNPGGHSSLPVPNNAIYHLECVRSTGSAITSSRFSSMTPTAPNWPACQKLWTRRRVRPCWPFSKIPTTPNLSPCSTRIPSGMQFFAPLVWQPCSRPATRPTRWPQRATANINCRIFPGVSRDAILAQLVKVAVDSDVKITIPEVRGPVAKPTPLTPQILKPVEKLADEMFPGAPVIPILQPGATDAQFLNPVGIPTYGISGFFADPDTGNVHGLNERIRVKSVYEGRTFLYRLVKLYADQ